MSGDGERLDREAINRAALRVQNSRRTHGNPNASFEEARQDVVRGVINTDRQQNR